MIDANEMRANAAAIDADVLSHFRGMLGNALQRKRLSMKDPSGSNVAALRKWERQTDNGEHDPALRVMLANGIPCDFFNRTVRGGGESFNVYAIPKTFLAASKLLSASPLWDGSSDAMTLRGTILAILSVEETNKKNVTNFLNDYMTKRGKGRNGIYTSGSTQGSSSAHALSALGLLNIPSAGDYRIPSPAARDVLERLSGTEGE